MYGAAEKFSSLGASVIAEGVNSFNPGPSLGFTDLLLQYLQQLRELVALLHCLNHRYGRPKAATANRVLMVRYNWKKPACSLARARIPDL